MNIFIVDGNPGPSKSQYREKMEEVASFLSGSGNKVQVMGMDENKTHDHTG